MRTTIALIVIIMLIPLTSFGASLDGKYIDKISLESEETIKFLTSNSTSQWYTIKAQTWGADLFEKANEMLTTATVCGKQMNVVYNTTKLTDGTYEVTSITLRGAPTPPPTYCDAFSDLTNTNTYVDSLILASDRRDSYKFTTTCTPSKGLKYYSVKLQTDLSGNGTIAFNRMFFIHLIALSKNKMLWIGCNSNTYNVISTSIF
jgi:hypothetical protein